MSYYIFTHTQIYVLHTHTHFPPLCLTQCSLSINICLFPLYLFLHFPTLNISFVQVIFCCNNNCFRYFAGYFTHVFFNYVLGWKYHSCAVCSVIHKTLLIRLPIHLFAGINDNIKMRFYSAINYILPTKCSPSFIWEGYTSVPLLLSLDIYFTLFFPPVTAVVLTSTTAA